MRSRDLLGPIDFSLIIGVEFPQCKLLRAAPRLVEHSGEEALTPKEFEVLRLIGAGNVKEIALASGCEAFF